MDLRALMDDFMNKDDLGLLTRDASELFQCPVMVVDMAFRAISWHQPAGFRDAPFEATIDSGSLSYEASSFLAGGARFVSLEDSPYRRRFSPLVSGGAPVGYLILVDTGDSLASVDARYFAQVESALAKQLMLELNRANPASTTEEAVLQSLLEGQFAEEALFDLQAASAGLTRFAPKRFAWVNLELYRSTNWSENALRRTILDIFPRARPLIHNGGVVFFLNSDPDMPLFEDLSRQFSLRVVVSAPMAKLYNLPEYFRAAQELMNCLMLHTSKPFAARAEDYHALMLLKQLSPRDDLVLPCVRALAARDAADQTPYCLTLYTYLCCHHSLQETCARLYTHRNTVLYRVKRMREDFGIPMDDPDQHLALIVSSALMLLNQGQDAPFMPTGARPQPAPEPSTR